MPAGYAALPSQDHGDDRTESNHLSHLNEVQEQEHFLIQASDEEDEDEDEDEDGENVDADEANERRPLNTNSVMPEPVAMTSTTVYPPVSRRASYDLAPPGSPPPVPRPDRAIPWNTYGNSNGIIPSSPVAGPSQPGPSRSLRTSGWLARAAGALLPTHYAQRVIPNDGVFSNVTAKPTVPGQAAEDENVHVMPEDAQKDAPPTYASASADAVPPYWEASSSSAFTPSSVPSSVPVAPGDLIIDGLQTGILFSFMWNLLVSVSFQFVGFLLTYIMHSTHAAKYGSRAGLGLTLVQYGFAMRSQSSNTGLEVVDTNSNSGDRMVWTDGATGFTGTVPSFDSAAEADAWGAAHPNVTLSLASEAAAASGAANGMNDFATDVIAFMLMTMGWFLLLTSLLGFYRVKRAEKAILAANQPVATVYPGSSSTSSNGGRDDPTVLGRFERAFAWRSFGITADMFRQGLGFRTRRDQVEEEEERREANAVAAAEELGQHVDWHELSLNSASGGRSIFVNHRFNDPRDPHNANNGDDLHHHDHGNDDDDDDDDHSEAGEEDAMMPQAFNADGTPLSPQEMQRVLQLLRDEQRLRRELTAAGLL